jgi:hypothetical protein
LNFSGPFEIHDYNEIVKNVDNESNGGGFDQLDIAINNDIQF